MCSERETNAFDCVKVSKCSNRKSHSSVSAAACVEYCAAISSSQHENVDLDQCQLILICLKFRSRSRRRHHSHASRSSDSWSSGEEDRREVPIRSAISRRTRSRRRRKRARPRSIKQRRQREQGSPLDTYVPDSEEFRPSDSVPISERSSLQQLRADEDIEEFFGEERQRPPRGSDSRNRRSGTASFSAPAMHYPAADLQAMYTSMGPVPFQGIPMRTPFPSPYPPMQMVYVTGSPHYPPTAPAGAGTAQYLASPLPIASVPLPAIQGLPPAEPANDENSEDENTMDGVETEKRRGGAEKEESKEKKRMESAADRKR